MHRSHRWVLLGFSLLAVALSWPLATRLTTHVPGSYIWAFDEYTFLWNIWYFKRALIDLHTSPLHTELLFYPLGLDLVMYTFNLLASGLALPLYLATGNAALASNLMNLAASALGGFGVYLLARYLLRPGASNGDARAARLSDGAVALPAAVLAGAVYAFASSRSIYLALGHYMIVTTQWVPFFALYFLRTLDGHRRRDAVLAGLFTALCLLTDMLYGVLLGLIAVVLLLSRWRQRTQRPSLPSSLGLLATVVAVAALLSAPLLIPTLREGISADYAVEGWGNADVLNADLAGLFTPTALHPVLDGAEGRTWEEELRAVQTGESRFNDVNTLFLGYATAALAVLGAVVGGRRARGWAALALLTLVLALGPLLTINGRSTFDLDGLPVTVPLPYIVFHYLPLLQGFRAPNRFSIVVMLALAVLAAYAAAWLLSLLAGQRQQPGEALSGRFRQIGAGALSALLIGLVLFEHLAVPMPLTDARVPAVYRQIAQQPGEFALLQLPMGWRNGFGVLGSEDTRVQWYQSVHGRPILSGNTSRNPPFKFDYFRRLPLVQAIAAVQTYGQPDSALDQAARQSAGELMALWNVRYLVVNPPVPGRYPYADTWQAARDYALSVLPVDRRPVWEGDGVQVYAVRQPSVPLPFALDFGAQDTAAYRGDGWSVDEADIAGASGVWAEGRRAELFFPVQAPQPPALRLTLRLLPFAYDGAEQQTVVAYLNGRDLGARALPAGWSEVTFDAPAAAVRPGLNRLRLRFGYSARPVDVLPGQGQIGSTGVQAPVDIEINSGGAAQDIAYITVTPPGGAAEDASAGRRGYNLTALDPRTGRVLDKRGFDTWANAYEAERLADFVARLRPGVIVVAAARDDASRHLTDRAVAALASLGSGVDLRQTPGYGHALIGVKGAASGTALEATGPQGAYLRLAADRRSLSAAADWLRVEEAP
ncbi:MAG: hypothetical protein NZ528_16690 [Caldilineales bacterium]|nr:hypothetical protein [Caldilineales bacterium]